jgi:hypothetical protein
MKYAIAMLAACCVIVAQEKPAAEVPKPAAVEKPAEAKPKIPSINVRDELIELIHKLKIEANRYPESPFSIGTTNATLGSMLSAKYEADKKAQTEAQRLLLQALVELAKEAEKDKPTKARHSSNPVSGGDDI